MTPRFRVIVADPAWKFGDRLRMSKVKRGADANYATMTIPEICALPVGSLAADDAVLCLWRPSALARDALTVMDAWGFRQTQELVWYKLRQSGKAHFGMGRLLRASKEVAYIGVRGNPYRHLRDKAIRDVFVSPPLRHSAKPECVQDALERMFPDGPFLELNARRDRDRWTCIGNEAPSHFGRDMRDVLTEMVARAATRATSEAA